jgi:exodeoxyribonuclease V beta subunit
MGIMHKFDSLAIDLVGHNLIEASAGTGKTYAIACLYLRLVTEFGLTPEEILVVTFTEAATKELRGRIRERLREARDVVAGATPKDDFLEAFTTEGRKGWPGMETALVRLEVALNGFDGAAISTIHGFCSRALQENVFESGSLYDTELVTDQRPFLEECVNDFWRRTFFGDDALLLTAAMQRGWSPTKLVRFLKGRLGNPEIIVEPLFSVDQEKELAAACAEGYLSLTSLWREKEGEIAAIITGDEGLSHSQKNYHPDLVPSLLAGMADYVAGGNPFDFCAGFDKFTTGFIRGQALKKHEPPGHPFFDSCERMKGLVDRRLIALKGALFQFTRQRLAELKNERNIRFFDDLLVVLNRALGGTSGEELARSLRERYKAALIDEFQDTDPVQYQIFHRIYSGKEAPLFLIGDPKQAIYSFRGADIFAYLEAKEDMPQTQRFTMDRNWRSTPEMVAGVNRLFQQKESRPFLFDALGFPQVTAAKTERPLSLVGRDPAPLQVWFMGRDENDGKFIPLGKARQRIVAAVAGEISGLLADGRDGNATIKGRSVLPEDIAVVVRSHKEAALVQNALTGLRIPSVVQSNESLFATREARDLFRVMEALAEPGNETSVRTALVTSVFGATGNDIA